jgi:hypothetical protein
MLLVPEVHFKYRELISTPKVYVDIDGTLSDFYRHFAHINFYDMRSKKITISDISPEVYRKNIKVRKYMHSRMTNLKVDYWNRIPMTKYGRYLWSNVRLLDPYLFTGVIDKDTSMEMGKIKWCRRRCHLGFKNADLNRILFNKNKSEYATNNGTPNILIDDDSQSCFEWEMAGGISYLYIDHFFVVENIVNQIRDSMISNPNIDFLLKWDQKLQRYVY